MVHRTTELQKRDLDDWPDRACWVTDITDGISGLLGHGDRPRAPRYQRGRSVDCRPCSNVRGQLPRYISTDILTSPQLRYCARRTSWSYVNDQKNHILPFLHCTLQDILA